MRIAGGGSRSFVIWGDALGGSGLSELSGGAEHHLTHALYAATFGPAPGPSGVPPSLTSVVLARETPPMRNLIASAVILVVSTSVAVAAPPPPPPAFTISLEIVSGFCQPTFGGSWDGALGRTVEWTNNTGSGRTLLEKNGFWNWSIAAGAQRSRIMSSAGGFAERCDASQSWSALPVRVKAPSAPSGTSFTVTWATSDAPASYRYGVQYRIGSGVWHTWKSGVSARSATFSGVAGKVYGFRARTKDGTHVSGWSPVRKVTT